MARDGRHAETEEQAAVVIVEQLIQQPWLGVLIVKLDDPEIRHDIGATVPIPGSITDKTDAQAEFSDGLLQPEPLQRVI